MLKLEVSSPPAEKQPCEHVISAVLELMGLFRSPPGSYALGSVYREFMT